MNQANCQEDWLNENPQITDLSNRPSAVSNSAKTGVGVEQLFKMTGHSNAKTLQPYLWLDWVHHANLPGSLKPGPWKNDVTKNNDGNAIENQTNLLCQKKAYMFAVIHQKSVYDLEHLKSCSSLFTLRLPVASWQETRSRPGVLMTITEAIVGDILLPAATARPAKYGEKWECTKNANAAVVGYTG